MVEPKTQEKGIVSAKEVTPAPRQFGKQDGLTVGPSGKPPEHIAKFADMIRENGGAGAYQVARMLGVPEHCWDQNLLFKIFKKEKQTGVSCTELIDLVVQAIFLSDSSRDFYSWSHTVCHLFENYRLPIDNIHSFLDDPSRFGSAKKLVDEGVIRAIKAGEPHCMSRVVWPLLCYNIDKMAAENLDGEFPFKPKSLQDEAFVSMLVTDKSYGYHSKPIEIFCTARTPKDLITQLVKSGEGVRGREAKMVELADALKRENAITAEEAEAYVRKICKDESASYDTVRDNIAAARNASKMADGLYVDVDGTLVIYGKPNEWALQKMVKSADSGKKVTIFSGGNPKEQTELLRGLGVEERFLPVLPKSQFIGMVLEELIDDTIPEYQGFRAVSWIRPDGVPGGL